jgi:hypothetical protein
MICSASHRSNKAHARRLVPIDQVEHVEATCLPSAERCSCKVCQSTFTGGQIVNGKPSWRAQDQTWCALRQVYCPHCGHVQNWLEACRADGVFTGMVLSGPGFLRGKTSVESFLRRHAHATGVLQR